MKYITYFFLILSISSCSQNNRNVLGEKFAKEELKLALSSKSQHNVINNKELILKDSQTAIKVVEPILFSIYGKDNIESEKPYETYLIDNYWVIAGTLSKDEMGGTFLIIIDARDSKVLKITHGK